MTELVDVAAAVAGPGPGRSMRSNVLANLLASFKSYVHTNGKYLQGRCMILNLHRRERHQSHRYCLLLWSALIRIACPGPLTLYTIAMPGSFTAALLSSESSLLRSPTSGPESDK